VKPRQGREEKDEAGEQGGVAAKPVMGQDIDHRHRAATEDDADPDQGRVGVMKKQIGQAAQTYI